MCVYNWNMIFMIKETAFRPILNAPCYTIYSMLLVKYIRVVLTLIPAWCLYPSTSHPLSTLSALDNYLACNQVTLPNHKHASLPTPGTITSFLLSMQSLTSTISTRLASWPQWSTVHLIPATPTRNWLPNFLPTNFVTLHS